MGDWACPRDGLVHGAHCVEVEDELDEGEEHHDEGGGLAGELLYIGEHFGCSF